jgi:integrase
LALEFAALTAVRKGESRTAKWDEIDLENGVWRCSQHKTKKKTGDDHYVPLSRQAIAVLEVMLAYKEASGIESDYVFPGSKGGKNPLSRTACNQLIRKLGYSKEEMSVHGLRTMFGEWAEEETDYEEKDSEISLGHRVGGTVRNAYKRHAPRIEKRRPLMQDWADYCDRGPPLPSEMGTVIDAKRRFPAKRLAEAK